MSGFASTILTGLTARWHSAGKGSAAAGSCARPPGEDTGGHEHEAYRKRIRRLTAQLVLAEERERRALAMRLHDGVGQSLAVAKMRLDALLAESPPKQVQLFGTQARRFVDEALGHTRSLTSDLSPPILYEVGLSAALKWLAPRFRDEYGLEVKVKADLSSGVLRESDRVLLFRATRELLMNVVKHAQAHSATVELSQTGEEVLLSVEDDGDGFCAVAAEQQRESEPAARSEDARFGLFSIQERVAHYGGEMTVRSAPGGGTRVQLNMPLRFAPGKAELPAALERIPTKAGCR